MLIQLFSVCMVLNNKSLCGTRLMVENQIRVKEFHRCMAALATLTPASGVGIDAVGDAASCSTFIAFVALVLGLIVPTAIACSTQMLVALPGWVRDINGSQLWVAGLVRGMCGVVAEGERKPHLLARGVQWWFLLHLTWVMAGLRLPGAVKCF
jgi:hypothetical protein